MELLEALFICVCDDELEAVEDLLHILEGHVEEVPDTAREALEEPDVRDWSGEVNVTESLASNF